MHSRYNSWLCESPAAPYLVFEHHGIDQGTYGCWTHRLCSQSSSTELRHGHLPLLSRRSRVHSTSGVRDDFCDFPTYTPRYECGGTTPNTPDATIHDPAGQAPTFFGHIARADSRMDHTRALRSIISGLPRDWKRPPWRPRRTWLRTIEQDLRPLNIGLVSAWQRTQDRELWKRTVETATLQDGACSWWWWIYSAGRIEDMIENCLKDGSDWMSRKILLITLH